MIVGSGKAGAAAVEKAAGKEHADNGKTKKGKTKKGKTKKGKTYDVNVSHSFRTGRKQVTVTPASKDKDTDNGPNAVRCMRVHDLEQLHIHCGSNDALSRWLWAAGNDCGQW